MIETLMTEQMDLSHPEIFHSRSGLLGERDERLRQAQQRAWAQYLELPTPVRTDERWRFSRLTRFADIGGYQPTVPAQADETALDRSCLITHTAGRIVLVDDNLAGPVELDPVLQAKGVIFTTLQQAFEEHAELVWQWFMKESPELGSEKFESLHLALLRNGVFLHIPDNVEVVDPFVVYYWARQPRGALFPHTLFVSGRHAKANLIEFQQGWQSDSSHFVVANAHLHAGDGSQPTHTIVQNWNLQTLSMQLNTNNAQCDTTATSTLINVGSVQARQEVHGKIFGSGSNVEMYALNVPKGDQEFDQRTLQTHIAPNSRSDLLFKNALLDHARTIFSGLIIVEENAQYTDAYQTNNNLMIGEDAEANSLPGLEIKANDVKCSHGATTGHIDQSELFYFLARGISPAKARELIVYGYFEEIISKLNHPEVADCVRSIVQHKFTD